MCRHDNVQVKELGIVEAQKAGEDEVELEDGLPGCFTADLGDHGPRAGYLVLVELLPIPDAMYTMAGQISSLAIKLLYMVPDWPEDDEEECFAQVVEHPGSELDKAVFPPLISGSLKFISF